MTIYRDGKLIYSGNNQPLALDGQLEGGRVVAAGVLKFGAGLQTGEYLLQIKVNDLHAKKKYSRVSEWIDFEVTKQ